MLYQLSYGSIEESFYRTLTAFKRLNVRLYSPSAGLLTATTRLVESGRIELHSVPVQNTISEEVSIYYLDNAHLHSLAVPFRSVTPLM